MRKPKCRLTYRKKTKNSRYRGVYKNSKGWFSIITNHGEREKYGPFTNEMEAAQNYDKKAVEYFGDNAAINMSENNHGIEIGIGCNESNKKNIKICSITKIRSKSKNRLKKKKNNRRIKFSVVTRNKVCSKQKWLCNYCKNLLSDIFIVDHIVPLFLGGTNDEYNLQALCPSCDRFKTSYIDYKILSPLSKKKTLDIGDVLEAQKDNYHKMMCTEPGKIINDNINNGTIKCHQYIANNVANNDLNDPKLLEMEIKGVKFKIKF